MPQAGWWKKLASGKFLANGLAFLGGIYYLFQSWGYAHTQTSVLDEGAYLVKGYLFALGQYWPYQDYGFWSNHMPLGFFNPRLRSGHLRTWIENRADFCDYPGWIAARGIVDHCTAFWRQMVGRGSDLGDGFEYRLD